MVTPFRRMVRWTSRRCASWCGGRSKTGIDFLVPCGTTGESPTLTREEHLRVVEITVEECQRQSAGAGGRGRLQYPRSDRTGARMRAPGRRWHPFRHARITTSPRRKVCTSTTRRSPTQFRCRLSFTTCRAAPASTSKPATLARLAEIENIVGVKEASGNISQMAEVLHRAARAISPFFPATMPLRSH